MLRATLKTIQLIATVTYPNLQKYGFEPILKPFIDDVNRLSKVFCNHCNMLIINHNVLYFQGLTLNLNGQDVMVKGAVLVMLADTQAAHAIGGFKVGVGFALRRCRDCLATVETMSSRVCCTYIINYLRMRFV